MIIDKAKQRRREKRESTLKLSLSFAFLPFSILYIVFAKKKSKKIKFSYHDLAVFDI